MSVLSRYLALQFARMLILVVPGLLGLYLLVEIFEKLDDVLEAGAPVGAALAYFALKLPAILFQIAPLAILLAALLSLMLLSKSRELLAFRSLGVGPWRVFAPFGISVLGLSLLLLGAQVLYIPQATARAQTLWQTQIDRHPSKGTIEGDRLFYHGKDCIWTGEIASPDGSDFDRIQLLFFDPEYRFRQAIAAEAAHYHDGVWTFEKGLRKTRDANATLPSVATFRQLDLHLEEKPEDFVAVEIPPDRMEIPQLWRSVTRLKRAGYPASEQAGTLWGQILYPFLALSLVWLGVPLTLSRERGGGISLGLALGMFFGFAAWVSWSFAVTLGKTGVVPAMMGPLGVHLVLASLGAYFWARLRF